MEVILWKNLIVLYFVQLIMKCILNVYWMLHYHYLMINDIVNVILKVNFGIEIYNYLLMYAHSDQLYKSRTCSGYLPGHGDSSQSTNLVDRQFLPENHR